MKMLGIVAAGVVRESRKFSGHPYEGRIAINKAINENSSLSYGASPAIWDHAVLPAT